MKSLITLILVEVLLVPTFASTVTPENELSLVTYTTVKNSIIQPGKTAYLPFSIVKLSKPHQFVDCHIKFDNDDISEVPSPQKIRIRWHVTGSLGEENNWSCVRLYQGVWGLKSWPAIYSPVSFDNLTSSEEGAPLTTKTLEDNIEIGRQDFGADPEPGPEPGVIISNLHKHTTITISDCEYSSYSKVLTNLTPRFT